MRRLHIVQGGVENGDKRRLERTAGSRRTLRSWVVPKAVQPGDDVVIHIGGHGLFATAVVKSSASPRKGWKNRYGADVGDIRLIAPPIPMAVVQQRVPELNWANYPRSVTTPVADVAAKLRALIRRKNGKVDAEPSGGDSFDRESAQSAALVLDDLLSEVSGRDRKACLRFLQQSIAFASKEAPDRWGVTLFTNLVRLNVGRTESVVLHSGGVNVLVDDSAAIPGTRLSAPYPSALGSKLRRVPFDRVVAVLPEIRAAHRSAMRKAMRYPGTRVIRDAHSPGIVKYLWKEHGGSGSAPTPSYRLASWDRRRQRSEEVSLEDAFDLKMWELYQKAKDEYGYNATRFLRKLKIDGGVDAAKAVLRPRRSKNSVPQGLLRMVDLDGVVDTVEATVLKPKWRGLFTSQELETARERLARFGYTRGRTAVRRLPLTLGELDKNERYPEGAAQQLVVNSYERSTTARKACISHYGARCIVCDVDFSALYGSVAKGFIHVHHLSELSALRKEYEVDPVADLRPVCPNCHAVIHMRRPPYSIQQVKNLMRRRTARASSTKVGQR